MTQSITYNEALDRFLLVGETIPNDGNRGFGGIYYATSTDLISWSERRLLLGGELLWTYECGDTNPIAYPSALDPSSTSRNFETTDERFYVYFTRFNLGGSCSIGNDRDLVRIPVEVAFGRP